MARVRCPAKINLHLEVGPRREDGFHEVATIFQAIGLWDELDAEPDAALTLGCDVPGLSTGEDNLVIRAARALQARFDVHGRGARLYLRKSIPAGGGLGGGSSDAAGALVLLSRVWGLPAMPADLTALAAGLGSDVAFFLRGGTAVGTGRGERISPAPALGRLSVVLGIPPFPIATAEAYRALAARGERAFPAGAALTPPAFGVSLRGLLIKLGGENDFGPARNDLEEVVLEGRPELAAYRRELSGAGARLALVSGSGSTVFGLFDRDDTAAAAAADLARRWPAWRTLRTRTVDDGVRVED